ncbi:hypothetical protein DW115_06865 [Clostridium sp. AM09-51]|nr:hypothetical protein DW115_06865 [Clostridium sp. AM09-51]
MTTSKVTIVKLAPSEGKHLKNVVTGEVYEGEIYLAKSLKASDFIEIDDTEYQQAKIKSSVEE